MEGHEVQLTFYLTGCIRLSFTLSSPLFHCCIENLPHFSIICKCFPFVSVLLHLDLFPDSSLFKHNLLPLTSPLFISCPPNNLPCKGCPLRTLRLDRGRLYKVTILRKGNSTAFPPSRLSRVCCPCVLAHLPQDNVNKLTISS